MRILICDDDLLIVEKLQKYLCGKRTEDVHVLPVSSIIMLEAQGKK